MGHNRIKATILALLLLAFAAQAAAAALPCTVSPADAPFTYPVARALTVTGLAPNQVYAVYVHPYPGTTDLGMFNLRDNISDASGSFTYLFAAPSPIVGQWHVEVYDRDKPVKRPGSDKKFLVAACGFTQT